MMLKLAFFQVKFLVLAVLVANSEALFFDILAQISQKCPADRNEQWTYRGKKGPENWKDTYPDCAGNNQSPIDINTADVERNEDLEKLQLNNYDQPLTAATIENNGHTVEVIPNDDIERTISVNGVLYELQQFHVHYGKDSNSGSEHLLNGKSFPMEVHFVHASDDRKLAVVGVFLEEQEEANGEWQPIVDRLGNVKYKGEDTDLLSELYLDNLLPESPLSFYRYDGSLTTPGCTEGVTWSVAAEAKTIGKEQLQAFRRLLSAERGKATSSCKIAPNYRPVQPLNGRQVEVSQ